MNHKILFCYLSQLCWSCSFLTGISVRIVHVLLIPMIISFDSPVLLLFLWILDKLCKIPFSCIGKEAESWFYMNFQFNFISFHTWNMQANACSLIPGWIPLWNHACIFYSFFFNTENKRIDSINILETTILNMNILFEILQVAEAGMEKRETMKYKCNARISKYLFIWGVSMLMNKY